MLWHSISISYFLLNSNSRSSLLKTLARVKKGGWNCHLINYFQLLFLIKCMVSLLCNGGCVATALVLPARADTLGEQRLRVSHRRQDAWRQAGGRTKRQKKSRPKCIKSEDSSIPSGAMETTPAPEVELSYCFKLLFCLPTAAAAAEWCKILFTHATNPSCGGGPNRQERRAERIYEPQRERGKRP